jgi:hypothetical protein
MVKKGKGPTRTRTVKQPSIDNNVIMFAGGLAALTGIAVGGYYWISSIQATQQSQQQINAAQQPAQATANAQAVAGGGLYPVIPPGTAAVTVGAVNPLGAFSTIFPFFGGAQFFTLTRRSCDPVIGGVPTQADLASQGVVITSYQVNNTGFGGPPAVCGIPKLSITVGTTDPSSAIKLQALGFVPGSFGGGWLGGLGGFVPPWSKPLLPTVYPPVGGFPGNVPPIFPGVIPPYPVPRPIPPAFPIPLPPRPQPWWYPYRFPKRKGRRKHDGHDRHQAIHVIGMPKHNFIRQVGHVLNFDRH